jgi:hypothetical protein
VVKKKASPRALDVTLPRIKAMFEDVVAKGPRTPTARAEALVRPGKRAYWSPPESAGAGPEVGVELPSFDGTIPFRAVPPPVVPTATKDLASLAGRTSGPPPR